MYDVLLLDLENMSPISGVVSRPVKNPLEPVINRGPLGSHSKQPIVEEGVSVPRASWLVVPAVAKNPAMPSGKVSSMNWRGGI